MTRRTGLVTITFFVSLTVAASAQWRFVIGESLLIGD